MFENFKGLLRQTFADYFTIKGSWGEAIRQIGNAAPVLLARPIGTRLITTLNLHDRETINAQLRSINILKQSLTKII